jgi:hypothetical protein
MRIYWSLGQVPEFCELSRAERDRVHRVCLSRSKYNCYRDPRLLLVDLPVVGLCSLAGRYGHLVFGLPADPIYQTLVGASIGGAIAGYLEFSRMIEYLRPYYAKYLEDSLHRDS